jgi:hypothetical protein
MRIIVPKMHWKVFLELTKGLSRDERFRLSNQDVESGMVKFRTEERLLLLNQILEYHNYGWAPPMVVKLSSAMKKAMKDLNFDVSTWMKTIENLSGPCDKGFYRGRCPVCGEKDEKGYRLSFNLEGAVKCWGGCKYMEIIATEGANAS